MKRVIVYTCTGFAVLLLGAASCKQKNTMQHVDDKEICMALDSSEVKNMPVLDFVTTKYDFGTAKRKDTPIRNIFYTRCKQRGIKPKEIIKNKKHEKISYFVSSYFFCSLMRKGRIL